MASKWKITDGKKLNKAKRKQTGKKISKDSRKNMDLGRGYDIYMIACSIYITVWILTSNNPCPSRERFQAGQGSHIGAWNGFINSNCSKLFWCTLFLLSGGFWSQNFYSC